MGDLSGLFRIDDLEELTDDLDIDLELKDINLCVSSENKWK